MRNALGTTLLVVGAAIAAVGAVGLAMGVHVTIPPTLLALAAYKAPFIVGAGLMLVGAAIRRRRRDPVIGGVLVAPAAHPSALMPPSPNVSPDGVTAREPDPLARERR